MTSHCATAIDAAPQISVIVPVYKTERYLPKCIDSVLSQSFTDFELLLVNDGSPDSSGEIAEKYARLDPRVKVIHQQNGGVSSARKKGLELARGNWITFVDSDDWLPADALQKLYEKSSYCDIVVGNVKTDHNAFIYKIRKCEDLSSEKWIRWMLEGVIHSGPVAKLIRRNFAPSSVYDIPREIVYGEDFLANVRIVKHTSVRIKLLTEVVYIYRTNYNSVSHVFRYTTRYGEKLYDLINRELTFWHLDLQNPSVQHFYLNILKHTVFPHALLDYENLFVKEGLPQLKYRSFSSLKDRIWLLLLKTKFIYQLYAQIRKGFFD